MTARMSPDATNGPVRARASTFAGQAVLAALALFATGSFAAPISSATLPTPVVVDSTGKVIGRAVGNNNVLVDLDGEIVGFHLNHYFQVQGDFGRSVKLIRRPGLQWASFEVVDMVAHELSDISKVYFFTRDCSGQGYLAPTDDAMIAGTRMFGQAFANYILPDQPIWGYVADASASITNAAFVTSWDGRVCNHLESSATTPFAYPVKKIVSLDALGKTPLFIK